jgi:hypothetical protein
VGSYRLVPQSFFILIFSAILLAQANLQIVLPPALSFEGSEARDCQPERSGLTFLPRRSVARQATQSNDLN